VWRIFTQGVALGYVVLPLRGVLFMSFDTPPLTTEIQIITTICNGYGRNAVASYDA
jgi:hypothetical protein